MKKSLYDSGYYSFESMRMLNAKSITEMEQHLKIQFLPAHKDYIFDIVVQIEKMEKKKEFADTPVRNQQKLTKEKKVKCKSNNSSKPRGFNRA